MAFNGFEKSIALLPVIIFIQWAFASATLAVYELQWFANVLLKREETLDKFFKR